MVRSWDCARLAAVHSLPLHHGRSYVHVARGSLRSRPFPSPPLRASVLALCFMNGNARHLPGAPMYVIRLGFEPKTHSLEGCCSIQLSYRTILKDCKDSIFYFNDNMLVYEIVNDYPNECAQWYHRACRSALQCILRGFYVLNGTIAHIRPRHDLTQSYYYLLKGVKRW